MEQPLDQQQQQPYQSNRTNYQYIFTTTQMRRYFYKLSSRYVWLLLLGLVLGILGIILAINVAAASSQDAASPTLSFFGSFSTYLILLGVGFLIWGGIPLLAYSDRPTDSQYADWVSERCNPLYEKALQRLHLDESQCESIIEVQGGISSLQQLTKKFPEKEVVVKRLRNGTRCYSINVAMYIFLTKDNLAIYSGYINAFTQNERFEDADHYYYTDIVGVSTSGPIYISQNLPYQEPLSYEKNVSSEEDMPPEEEIQMQGFLVRMNNGDARGTDCATSVILRKGENGVKVEGVDEVVAILLHLLRDHKISAIEANTISGDLR